MKLRKSQIAALLLIALSLILGACMNTATAPEPTQNPFSGTNTSTGMPAASATPGMAPEGTDNGAASGQGANQSTQTGTAQRYDWNSNAEAVENRIGQISEISECRILVSGDTALVGVKFTPQYQGEMTERIQEMIAGQVKAADPQLQTVAVTANADDVARIFKMSDAVKSGQSVDELDSDIDSIVRNATTMR